LSVGRSSGVFETAYARTPGYRYAGYNSSLLLPNIKYCQNIGLDGWGHYVSRARSHVKVRMQADLESGDENELVRIATENGLDSVTGRKAQAQLQLLVAEKQTAAAPQMCKATEGPRRAAVWLTIATLSSRLGHSGR
jgi:hypothetical protein